MTSSWATTDEVLAALRVDPKTLRRLQRDSTAAGIDPPWLNVGVGGRATYRWDAGRVDESYLDPRWALSLREAVALVPEVGTTNVRRMAAREE